MYHDKGTPPKKGGGSSFTVTKLASSIEPKGHIFFYLRGKSRRGDGHVLGSQVLRGVEK